MSREVHGLRKSGHISKHFPCLRDMLLGPALCLAPVSCLGSRWEGKFRVTMFGKTLCWLSWLSHRDAEDSGCHGITGSPQRHSPVEVCP